MPAMLTDTLVSIETERLDFGNRRAMVRCGPGRFRLASLNNNAHLMHSVARAFERLRRATGLDGAG